MFINILAITFVLFAIVAEMDTILQGFLFIFALCAVSALLFLFITFPGLSGLSVAIILAAFIFRQSKK
jgi:hypothetical protein